MTQNAAAATSTNTQQNNGKRNGRVPDHVVDEWRDVRIDVISSRAEGEGHARESRLYTNLVAPKQVASFMAYLKAMLAYPVNPDNGGDDAPSIIVISNHNAHSQANAMIDDAFDGAVDFDSLPKKD